MRMLSTSGTLRVAVSAFALWLLTSTTPAADFPSWWTGRGVLKLDGASQPVAPDDFAVVNQGQLKNLALAAYLECEEQLPGGAGPVIGAMIADFQNFNLSLRPTAVATQSSGGFDAPADLARDGNVDGNFWAGSVFHTGSEPQPWWQIDLQSSGVIESVEVWNRTDCCGERTTNFYVLVSDSDMSQRTLNDLLSDATVWKSPKITSPPIPNLTVPVGTRGRFVMVRLEGTQFLHLAEVKVNRQSDDFAVATVGQLKAVADPFYTRFAEVGLGMRFLWPVHGNTDDYAVANIGQAKALFNFELNPTVLPTPDPVEGVGGAGSSIAITWTGVPSATGYRVERRHPFGSGALSQWSTIATPVNTVTSYTDFAVALDGIYAYRVFAIRDTQESLPSDEVWLRFNGPDIPPSIPDGDDNGIPDQDEGTGDTDGDGTDDAHDADNDNDGTPDREDRWPKDSRRSDFVPMKFFGLIDLSKNTYPDSSPVEKPDAGAGVRVNNLNQVSWLTTREVQVGTYTRTNVNEGITLSPIMGREHIATTWQNGAVTKSVIQDEATGSEFQGEDTWSNHQHYRGYTLRVMADGTKVGSFTESDSSSSSGNSGSSYVVSRGYPGDVRVPGTFLLPFDPPRPEPDDNTPFHDTNFSVSLQFAHDTGTAKIGSFAYVTDSPAGREQNGKIFRGNAAGMYVPDGSDGRHAVLGPISDNGHTLLVYPGTDQSTIFETKVWLTNGALVSLERVHAMAINNEAWVVGSLHGTVENPITHEPEPVGQDPVRGALGFVWDTGNGKRVFHDLLPEKYKKQFKDAIPFLVTDSIPTQSGPTIVFFASTLTGEPGQEIWTTGTFLWWKELDGTPKIASVAVPAGQFIAIDSINKHLAVSGTDADGNPVLGFPVSFSSTAIEKGFDPPMPGDVHITYGEDDVELSRVRDEDNPEWWTSVCNVSAHGKEGIQGDLNVNDHIRVIFENNDQAQLCEIIPTPASRALIDLQIVGGMSAQTALKITGKPFLEVEIKDAQICVYPKAGVENGPAGRQAKTGVLPLATLKVMVMPKVPLTLGVWKVSDANNPNDTSIPALVDPIAILGVVNQTFRQTCVVFDGIEFVGEEFILSPYDIRQPFHVLNMDADESTTPSKYDETFRLESDIPKIAEVNLAVVRELAHSRAKHLTRGNDQISFMRTYERNQNGLVPLDASEFGPFCIECAHEIGHQLGLSSRKSRGKISGFLENHDAGPFPYPDKLTHGVMMGGEKTLLSKVWLRHEDWRIAWEFAVERKGETNWSPRQFRQPLLK